MSKIKIKVEIINEEERQILDTTGILSNEILKYLEENKTLVLWNYEKNILTRENDEWKMTYLFVPQKKTTGIIKMKDMQRNIKLEIETEKIERKDHDIKIYYLIEGKKYLYQIEEIK